MRRVSAPFGVALALVTAFVTAFAGDAWADAAALFGQGARTAGLAQADVADPIPAEAVRQNPALVATPGVRARVVYGYGGLGLRFDGAPAGVTDASGIDILSQFGAKLGSDAAVGAGMAIHVPDRSLGKLGFRPASEPQFPLYEAPLQRTGFDLVTAFRWRFLAIGAGVSLGLSAAGSGTSFTLGQDARGPHADGGLDLTLKYRVSPVFGMRVDLGRVAIGASLRGPTGLGLRLDNAVSVRLHGNPLDGTTLVRLSGTAGYDPALFTAGVRVAIAGGVVAFASLDYAFWSGAPPPVANVSLDADLTAGVVRRAARYVLPGFHDTIAPRVGFEWKSAVLDDKGESSWRWAARLGYAMAASPVPDQTGLTTYADATRHQIAIGGGYHVGRVWGIDLGVDVAAQAHLLTPRAEDKASGGGPYAHFTVGGRILYGAASLEARWH